MKFKKIISCVLSSAILFNLMAVSSANAETSDCTSPKDIYLDGVAYHLEIDENFNITVTAETSDCEATMILDENLNGTVVIDNAGSEDQEYSIDINSLDVEEEVFDAVIVNENDPEEVTEVCYEDLTDDDYSGQVTLAAGGTIVVGSLLSALIYATLAVTIAGVTCYAVSAVADAVKNSRYYYKAYGMLNTVFVNPNPIDKASAVARVSSGDSVYTFTKDMARGVVSATGLGVVGPESHWAWYKIGDYYWHYHTGNRNGAHVWYGLAI